MDHRTNRWEETHMQAANSKGWEVCNGLLSGTISVSNAYFILGQPHVLIGPFLVQNFIELINVISAICMCLHLMNALSQFNFLFIFIRWLPLHPLEDRSTEREDRYGIQLHLRMNHNSSTSHAPNGETGTHALKRRSWHCACHRKERPQTLLAPSPLRNHGFLDDGHKP